MPQIEARCTQCGHTNYGSKNDNTNTVKYDIPVEETTHGGGKTHGTEEFICPQCSSTCKEDWCSEFNPCSNCSVRTLHNRAGSNVPRN